MKSFNCVALPESVPLKGGSAHGASGGRVALHSDLGLRSWTDGFGAGGGYHRGLAFTLLLRIWKAGKIIVSEVTETQGAGRGVRSGHCGQSATQECFRRRSHVIGAVRNVAEEGVDVAFDARGLQTTLDTASAHNEAERNRLPRRDP